MIHYLVTGGAGFIGSNFIMHLLDSGSDVSVINVDCLTYAGNLENLEPVTDNPRYRFIKSDIRDITAIQKVFSENIIDYVINFAAESHVDRSIENPDIFAQTNILGTLNLLNAAKASWQDGDGYRNGVRFLQVSTDEVYGSLEETGFFTEVTPLSPHSPYSASKASADMFVKSYFDTYNMPVVITRCSNNYGPYQFPEKLIPVIIINALNHRPIPIYGDGLNVRDWLYVTDHCRAIKTVLHKGVDGEAYNIGGNNEMRNIEIVKIILNYLHDYADNTITEKLITYVEDRKGHDRRYAIDPSKINRELGWSPAVSFKDGIAKTIDWYLNNIQWLDNIATGRYRE